MKATSIHLKACDIGSAEAHNKREKELDYIRKDLSELNESFSYIDHSLQTEEANIRREVKAKTGRKLQKNAIPIKEGVIVIDENTTLKDLQNFCEECRTKFGMIPLSIDIHRDEGHPRAKKWKPNLHAHIIWRMYDENGRNARLSKQDLADMQTLAAHHLHMERGKRSDKKHLSSLQYKIKAETERLESIKKAIDEAENQLITAGFWNKKTKQELAETKNKLDKANETIEKQKESIEDLKLSMRSAKDTNTRLLKRVNEQKADIANIEAIRAEKEQIKADYSKKEKELLSEKSELNAEKREVRQILSNVKNNLDDVLKVTSGTSLTTSQAIDIASGKDVEVEDFFYPGSGRMKMSDIGINRNIIIRWSSQLKTLLLKADGLMQKSMHDPKWRPLEDWINRFKTMLNDIRERSMNRGKSMGLR